MGIKYLELERRKATTVLGRDKCWAKEKGRKEWEERDCKSKQNM